MQTLAFTLIKIAHVIVTVRAYLSDFPDFDRMPLHLTLYAVASHKALASRILGAHRSRVVASVPAWLPVERDIFMDACVGLRATLYFARHTQLHFCRKSWT